MKATDIEGIDQVFSIYPDVDSGWLPDNCEQCGVELVVGDMKRLCIDCWTAKNKRRINNYKRRQRDENA